MGANGALEVAKTVLEVADVAWTAMEVTHHHHHHHHNNNENKDQVPSQDDDDDEKPKSAASVDEELESLRKENCRLKNLLEQNMRLLQNLSESPCLSNDCPPDLYDRLVATVDSEDFLTRLKSFQQASVNGTSIEFPFKEATGDDIHSAEILINIDHEEPSWWVWVTEEMVLGKVEEKSGIDNDSYVVVTEEHVVDGVANFMAKCIVSNPKAQNLTPKELQKTLAKALNGVNKFERILDIWHAGRLFYVLSTWGLALAGLYQSRKVVRLAAMGVHTTSRVVLRAL